MAAVDPVAPSGIWFYHSDNIGELLGGRRAVRGAGARLGAAWPTNWDNFGFSRRNESVNKGHH